jgi:hypothetical protein
MSPANARVMVSGPAAVVGGDGAAVVGGASEGRGAIGPDPDRAADKGRAGERKAREPAASEGSVSDAVCRHYL